VQPLNGAALQLYAPAVAWLNGQLVTVNQLNAPGNPGLQPERSVEIEGGADLGLWANRVSFELTGYSKTTHDALVNTSTGWDLGSYAYEENIGEVRNTGVEGTLTATVIQAPRLSWDVALNASINHNTLLRLAPGIASQVLIGGLAQFRQAPGYPLYGYWGPRVQFADRNHNGVIEPGEVTVADSASFLGSSLPTREASAATHVGLWRGLVTVGALFDYRGGFQVANTTAYYQAHFAQNQREQNDRAAPLWLQARSVAAIVAPCCRVPADFYEDGTYVRFRELSLTLALPNTVARLARVASVSLTGAVRNLALWTRYTGADPEASNTLGQNGVQQFTSNTSMLNNDIREDINVVPLARYWVVRLNVGF
jgi:TonB-dependent receptor-like protein